jgi:hypothetical protein
MRAIEVFLPTNLDVFVWAADYVPALPGAMKVNQVQPCFLT